MTIGKKIFELRSISNMTQFELGAKIGVSEKVISKWEREETKPNIDFLPLIADCFKINIDDLFEHKHNYDNDIKNTVFEYTQSYSPELVYDKIRELSYIMCLGAEKRKLQDTNLYDENTIDDIFNIDKVFDYAGRPTIGGNAKGYVNSIKSDDIDMLVLQITGDNHMQKIFQNYNDFRFIFEMLSIPNASVIFQYLYSVNSSITIEIGYLAEKFNISEIDAKKIINSIALLAKPHGGRVTKVIIDNKERELYSLPQLPDEILTMISVAYELFIHKEPHGHYIDAQYNGMHILKEFNNV